MRPAEGGATGLGEGRRTAESDWERSDWLLEFAPSETRKSAAQLFTDTANDTARVAQMELIPDQLATTREGDPSAGAKHLFFVFVVLNQSAVSVGYGQRPLNVKQLRIDFRINR